MNHSQLFFSRYYLWPVLHFTVKPTKQKQFEPGEITSRQEVGNDVILHCSANREVHLCRWKTPYLNTYIVGEGIYVERGRIQWLGSDPNYDCTIRVANLDLRDSGTWVCEIGSSTKESFQVQTKEFVIDIESKFLFIKWLKFMYIYNETQKILIQICPHFS